MWKFLPKALAGLGLVATAATLLLGEPRGLAPTLLWAAWTVLPPVWFIFEWSHFPGGSGSPQFNDFKYSQDLASKIWVAVAGVLTIIRVAP